MSDRRVWPAEAEQLAAMRAEVYRWLAPLGLPDDAEHDLVLAVSEAASNAIEHAYRPGDPDGRVELAFWLSGGSLHLAVVDHGAWLERPTGSRGRGFGLPLMRRLVETVAIDHDSRGTRVVLQHPVAGVNGHADGTRPGRPEPVPDEGAGHR
jgi:anti-sigma regulatory factor (Ser/Thr protein kinase)